MGDESENQTFWYNLKNTISTEFKSLELNDLWLWHSWLTNWFWGEFSAENFNRPNAHSGKCETAGISQT
jgi:hypothetical protein